MKSPTYTVPPASGSPDDTVSKMLAAIARIENPSASVATPPKPAAPVATPPAWYPDLFSTKADDRGAVYFRDLRIETHAVAWPVAARLRPVRGGSAGQEVVALWFETYNPTTGELRREFELLDVEAGTEFLHDMFKRWSIMSDTSGAASWRVHQLGGDAACEAVERMAAEARWQEPIFDAAADKLKIEMLRAVMAELRHRQSEVDRRDYLRAFADEVVSLYGKPAALKVAPVDRDARARRIGHRIEMDAIRAKLPPIDDQPAATGATIH